MRNYERYKLEAQVSVLKDVAQEYGGRTIENIISNLEARLANMQKHDTEAT